LVPLKLVLKNFMCYKNATLNLDGVHLACLSGDNGAGKSAILDAMTWTLWGKARASSDELISQGEIEMQTDFEFLVGEQHYRIVRSRTRKSSGHTELNFQIGTPEGGWRNIGDNSQRATQERIVKELRMEYETFINSAFLLQGRADEFTTKTAGERKKVLAEILGLSYYDELEAQSKEQSKEAESRRRRLDERLTEITQALDQRPRYEQQKCHAEEQLATSRAILEQSESELNQLQTRENALRAREEERQRLLKRLTEISLELSDQTKKLEDTEQRIELCRQVLDRREQIETGFHEYQETEQEYEALMQKFHRYQELITRRRKLEDQIERNRSRLEGEKRGNEVALREAEEQSRTLPTLEKEAATLQIALVEVRQVAERLETQKSERQKKQTELGIQEGESKRLTKQLKEITEKANRVPAVGDRCDRCGTVLDTEAHEHTLEEYRKEYRDVQATSKEAKQKQDELKAELQSLDKAVSALEEQARRLVTLEKQSGVMEQKLTQARQAGQKATNLSAQLVELNRQLEKEDFALKERQERAEVDQQLQTLAYNHETYQRVKGQKEALEKFKQEKSALDTAQERIISLKDMAELYRQRQADLNKSRTETQTQADGLAKEVAELAEISAKRKAAQERKAALEAEVKAYDKLLMEAELKLRDCDKLAEEKKLKEAERHNAARELSIYKDLAEAFGKKGLQALIIDTVLPELEDEANRLLSNMSDGRMTVRFDTLRDSKKGEAIETLDLRISDENGSRPYELFSGGEAFRVNFAVRVALSKLLARRSGAALRTLVIDEGFGTQDGTGRERLVEAIRSIENEFERVLVVTHIQELKDVFPVRIDVVKTNHGSQITVN
jgi:DNA repair protein SbcC/Rad50